MVKKKDTLEKNAEPAAVGPEAERIVLPEKKVEVEKPPAPEVEKAPPPAEAVEKPSLAPPPPPKVAPPPPPKSAALIKVEKILEEDLVEFYFKMPPEQQKIFKAKGEETASKIEKMIKAGKAAGRKILNLIREWLKLIPGVNKFFLEQEAKIKTDKIVAMAEREKRI